MAFRPFRPGAIKEDLIPETTGTRQFGSATKLWLAAFITTLTVATLTLTGTVTIMGTANMSHVNMSSATIRGNLTVEGYLNRLFTEGDIFINSSYDGTKDAHLTWDNDRDMSVFYWDGNSSLLYIGEIYTPTNLTRFGSPSWTLGYNAENYGLYGIAMGESPQVLNANGIAIGDNARSQVVGAIAIGKDVTANASYSIAFGDSINNTGINSIIIGSGTSASNKLDNGGKKMFGVGFNESDPTFEVRKNEVRIQDALIIEANITKQSCNGGDGGKIYYDDSTKHHYGCNTTAWNALY